MTRFLACFPSCSPLKHHILSRTGPWRLGWQDKAQELLHPNQPESHGFGTRAEAIGTLDANEAHKGAALLAAIFQTSNGLPPTKPSPPIRSNPQRVRSARYKPTFHDRGILILSIGLIFPEPNVDTHTPTRTQSRLPIGYADNGNISGSLWSCAFPVHMHPSAPAQEDRYAASHAS